MVGELRLGRKGCAWDVCVVLLMQGTRTACDWCVVVFRLIYCELRYRMSIEWNLNFTKALWTMTISIDES